ncbi:YdiH family protein [uncultured Cedecea sp.]|uniref:YdiH family protein n=1 Tax=uncultured Cedecea sp. TaxID=988762 RepID=UPI002610935F|nr:YdiH family protein [uncultured Cedecea sp.]
MDARMTPSTLAIEFLRRENTKLTPAQYLSQLQQLTLEFADLMELTSRELHEEISYARQLGIH